jgi:7,8-dihydroneopterin aldolase/epimerase/oxygenase
VTPSDRLELRGIRAWSHVGLDPGEQDVPQPLDIDVAVELDLSGPRASDDLRGGLSYRALYDMVQEVVRRERVATLERLGDIVLASLMNDPRISTARIALAKPRLFEGATPVVVLHAGR